MLAGAFYANLYAVISVFSNLASKSDKMKKVLIALLATCYLLPITCKAQTWVTIPDANFVTYLQSIIPSAMSGNQMNTSSTLVTTTTHSINANGHGITNLSGIQYFTSLTQLICGISLTSLPALPNSLQTLVCSGSSLTSLPALPNTLTNLQCYSNNLTSLPSLPNLLQTLVCSNNSLTTLPTLPNTLTCLDCTFNNIACFPTFPNSITDSNNIQIYANPYNCLPNHIAAMSAAQLATPLCAADNSKGCPVAVAGIKQVTSVNEQVSIYPNPAKDVINVKGLPINEETHIQLMDMFGNFVMEYITSVRTKDIDVSSLNEGVYNLSISNKEGTINKKLVKVN